LTAAGLVFQEHALSLLRQLEIFLREVSSGPGQLHGTLLLGVVPILDTALVPHLLGKFAARYPSISVSVEEVSSTEIETALEEGRMDLGLGFVTHHSPNLRYERLCSDEFALIVPRVHPWWNRQVIDLSEIHQQRLVQLPDSFVTRRMTDEICRNHQIRPRTIAEISAIETLLRSLAPLKAAALMPKIALLGTQGLKLKAIRLGGKNLKIEIGLLRLKGSGGNSTVQAFGHLTHAVVPKLVKKRNSITKL
jgi:LysR family cyn operon transcriptional activator